MSGSFPADDLLDLRSPSLSPLYPYTPAPSSGQGSVPPPTSQVLTYLLPHLNWVTGYHHSAA